ncbi:hypothetical protein QE152_g33084 [Popillia japonica]|uniref:Uncharacterized protein n=1 Tax=Popillia japonica TaxID=7064 RepID=A0AAW1IXU8_POPJA
MWFVEQNVNQYISCPIKITQKQNNPTSISTGKASASSVNEFHFENFTTVDEEKSNNEADRGCQIMGFLVDNNGYLTLPIEVSTATTTTSMDTISLPSTY